MAHLLLTRASVTALAELAACSGSAGDSGHRTGMADTAAKDLADTKVFVVKK